MSTAQPCLFCPQCEAAVDADQQFCGQCGADVQNAPPSQVHTHPSQVHTHKEPATRRARPASAAPDPMAATEGPAGSSDRRAIGDAWLGRVIDSRYRVDEIIGHGGMGVVYKVEHLRMGKVAAMKVVHHDLAGDSRAVSRFQREAEAVSKLTHPNTVQVFDFGTADDALYLIMEYVRGTDLGELVKRDGPMAFSRAAPLFAQICNALAEAHAIGVVHRDLKPDNILVTRTHAGRDFAKVLDFGLAKFGRDDRGDVTEKGSIVGTPYFMSPEQIRGENVDARSDVYSLGALMYKVLTGEYIFTAKSPVGILTKHLTETVVPPSQRATAVKLPRQADAILLRCLAKNRADRYSTVSQIVEDLERAYVECLNASQETSSANLFSGFGVGSSSSTSQRSEADVDYGIRSDLRLRRSDIDDFESKLRRRFWFRIALVPLLLLAAAGAALYFFMIQTKPLPTQEAEPNNSVATATRVDGTKPFSGYLGKRIDIATADQDFFQVTGAAADGGSLTLSVTSPPNMDISVSLYTEQGHLLMKRDAAGQGQTERIRRRRVRGTPIIAIEQVRPQSMQFPIENVSDAYQVTLEYHAPSSAHEVEPNDDRGEANMLALDQEVSAHFDRSDDIDRFRFDGPNGEYKIQVNGLPANTWKLEVRDQQVESSDSVRLEIGEVISVIGLGQPKSSKTVDSPYVIRIVR